MAVPQLSSTDVECIIPSCKVVGESMEGGQKRVFPCILEGKKYAIKFILLEGIKNDLDGDMQSKIDSVRARAEREINIMSQIDSPNVIKMGDIPLTCALYKQQTLLYYSEEWVDGESVYDIIKRNGKLSFREVLTLGHDIVQGISELWKLNKVHRDIKPLNIMRRKSDGSYVLLDLGLAFDLDDKSLTQFGYVLGTKIYLSPEQLDIMHKRDIDFRSDLFSLGIVLYQSITGKHPFFQYGIRDEDLFYNITQRPVIPPKSIDPTIPEPLNSIICRLLSKQPSGRYRKCSILINELNEMLDLLEV